MNYYRITAYNPTNDLSVIVDSYGLYNELWKFSLSLSEKGFRVIHVAAGSYFLEGTLPKVEKEDSENYLLRAYQDGLPKETTLTVDGVTYKAVQVDDKIYVPNKTQMA